MGKDEILEHLKDLLGKEIDIVMDRPLGTIHPKHKEIVYPINYGYIDGFYVGDNEYQDVYILGEDKPLKTYHGRVVAIVHRFDDNEDKLVVYNHGNISADQIEEAIEFQKKYFKHEIISV